MCDFSELSGRSGSFGRRSYLLVVKLKKMVE